MTETNEQLIAIRTPRLDPVEKLYVRAFLSTLSHVEAHKAASPGIAKGHTDNTFSRRENVQFHISLGLQEKAEAIALTADDVISRLWKEAIREGAGSNHSARIQALQILGKHLGLFQDKKEDLTPTFNIINYGTPITSDQVEVLEQIQESVLEESIPDNIQLTEYNEY